MSINIPILCGNVDSFKTTFMVISSVQSTTTRRAAILRRVVTVATARCSAYCVFAQRFSIQPLGSLRWPEAEQKHTTLHGGGDDGNPWKSRGDGDNLATFP